MERIEFAARTDVGRKRDQNEDNFLVDRELGLFIVCDGMGGHASGEIASALAVRTVHEEIKKERALVDGYVAGKKGGDLVTKRDVLNMLEFAVNRASSQAHAEAASDGKKRGMGTTIVLLLALGSQAFVVHVGDSRLYLLRDGLLDQITEDHNVHNELIRRKKMSRGQAEQLAPKNAITRAVGVYEHCEPDGIVIDVAEGDRLLLCSDWLSQYFEEDLDGLSTLFAGSDGEAAAQSLIDAANERGGSDNITALVVTVGPAGAGEADRAQKLKLRRETLARMPLFRPLNERELLRVLQVTDVVSYADGDVVMQEGEPGDALFIVLGGTVDVLRGDATLATLAPGEHVGEMALTRSQPRSATVRSAGPSELMITRRHELFEILRSEHQLAVKLLWQFLGVLSDRLADTSRELGEARDALHAEDITQDIFADEEFEDEDR
ncbi:MAG: cyclic nucleotide-binding domain-containing protein, partial [Deltaproteobacteria bacterium]|nr:cyclic nucleotide-binding domain-containing protein [Deltaproteobacteria bacterium]